MTLANFAYDLDTTERVALAQWLFQRAPLSVGPHEANRYTLEACRLRALIDAGQVPTQLVPLVRRVASAYLTVGETQHDLAALALITEASDA